MRAGVAGVLLPPPEPDPEVDVEVGAPEVLLVAPIPPAPAPAPTPLLPDADDCAIPVEDGIVIKVVCDIKLPVNEPDEFGGSVTDLALASSDDRDADNAASSALSMEVVVADVTVNVALEVTEDVVDRTEVLFGCVEDSMA